MATSTELIEFKKTVVDEALKAANRHGWCDEVKRTLARMGLGEFLPTKYVIQSKIQSNGGWYSYYDTDRGYADVEKGLKVLTRVRAQSLRNQKDSHKNSEGWRKVAHDREQAILANQQKQTLSLIITADSDVDELKDQLVEAKKNLLKPKLTEFKPREFKPTKYPMYRLVKTNGVDVEVVPE